MDTKTLYAKLATVPMPIKKWLGSDNVIDATDKMESQFILPTGSSGTIAKLIQKVQIKELHPDYFSGQLASELNLDRDKAIHITAELKRVAFLPIKNELSSYGIDVNLFDKFQMPDAKPTVIEEAPKIILNPPPGSSEPTKKPTTLSDVGWSRSSSAGPGIKLTTEPAAPQPLRPSSGPAPVSSIQPLRAPSAPTPVPLPATPIEPAPIMLHEDTTFKAAGKNAGFTLTRPGSGAEVHMAPGVPQAPQKPAFLEFGGANNKPVAPANKPTSVPSSGAIHYTELTLSLAAVPTANSGPRSVSQIVSPAPTQVPVPTPPSAPTSRPPQAPIQTPAQPPRAPSAPMPTPPPAPPNSKPIVKDFL
jgi:hypothetical protein